MDCNSYMLNCVTVLPSVGLFPVDMVEFTSWQLFLWSILKQLFFQVMNLWLLFPPLAGASCGSNMPSFTRLSGRKSGFFILFSEHILTKIPRWAGTQQGAAHSVQVAYHNCFDLMALGTLQLKLLCKLQWRNGQGTTKRSLSTSRP